MANKKKKQESLERRSAEKPMAMFAKQEEYQELRYMVLEKICDWPFSTGVIINI